jgi:hypothetical protein
MVALKAYLKIYFLIVLGVLTLIATFNFVVDPYNLFRSINIVGFNQEKPYLDVRGLSRVKAIDLAKGQYDTLILGTSRVFWGLDPTNNAFGSRRVYNAGLLSASSYQIYRVFTHAHRYNRLKTVIIGLDINAFDAVRPLVLPDQDFNQSAFVSPHPLLENLKTLLSYDTLIYSFKTVQFNREGKIFDKYTDRGFIRPESFHLDRHRNFQLVAKNILEHNQKTRFSYRPETMQFLIDIVQVCHREGIELKLFIEPTHIIMQEWVERSANSPIFARWKKALVYIVTKYAPNNPKIVLWDFSGFNSINAEPVPKNPQQPMQWYIDPVHYTKETGDLILGKILNDTAQSAPVPPDFGTIINAENITTHLENLRKFSSP